MFSQYFGSFLLNQGLITAAQLNETLGDMDSVKLKLGVLAINAGYMTSEQVSLTRCRSF